MPNVHTSQHDLWLVMLLHPKLTATPGHSSHNGAADHPPETALRNFSRSASLTHLCLTPLPACRPLIRSLIPSTTVYSVTCSGIPSTNRSLLILGTVPVEYASSSSCTTGMPSMYNRWYISLIFSNLASRSSILSLI